MRTNHIFRFMNSAHIGNIILNPIALVVTSPPYPMIEMWDNVFGQLNPEITERLSAGGGAEAFELMHKELDRVWEAVDKHLIEGGIVCINIGDATRKIGGLFQMFSSHTRIIQKFLDMGYHCLPSIIWKKATNSPNKFMGSGMLPPNAYVTLEHEHILIFRKGEKRVFKETERIWRRQSSYFWEERNVWFSDLWDIRGTRQSFDSTARDRSAAFPFEIPYRLIQMYSIKGDWILDPFAGTGTTTLAAVATTRNSIGIDMAEGMRSTILQKITAAKDMLNEHNQERLKKHIEFLKSSSIAGKQLKHRHNLGFSVVTSQETELEIDLISKLDISETGDDIIVKADHTTIRDYE